MWSITIKIDEGNPAAGSYSAIWTEEDGSTFAFSDRSEIGDAGEAKFLRKAEAALKVWRARKATEATLSEKVTVAANAVKR